MALDLVIHSHGPAINRARNDFLQYKHRVGQDRATPEDILDDFDPFLRFIAPFVSKAWHVKVKCAAVLARAGVLRPGLKHDRRTGKCRGCGGMRGFFSPVSYVELGAAAGCPSCVLLLSGVEQYGPGKRALSRPRLYMMNSCNSGCAGRQFVRDKRPSATSHGAMGVTVGGEEHGLELNQVVVAGPKGHVNSSTNTLQGFSKKKKTRLNKGPVELNFFGTEGKNVLPQPWAFRYLAAGHGVLKLTGSQMTLHPGTTLGSRTTYLATRPRTRPSRGFRAVWSVACESMRCAGRTTATASYHLGFSIWAYRVSLRQMLL